MKIAWISYDFGEYSIRQAAALAELHEVLLVLPDDQYAGQAALLEELGVVGKVDIHHFHKPRLRQPLGQVTSIRAILRRIHRFQPDVIHYQQGHLWFNGALRWLKQYPLVVTIHDPRHHAGDAASAKTPQWVIDYGFRCADQVIVHGQHLVNEVVTHLGIAPDRIHVIPHVAMGNTAAAASTRFPEDHNLVLFFGRIWDYKGLDYLIRAQPLISRELPQLKIMIAGAGADFQRYRDLMQDPKKFIVHNEWISDEQRAEFFQRAALVVLPYIEATQSGVVPVASTFAKPVVASRVGALPDCIEHGRTGLLVPPADVRALAEAIVTLMSDAERRHAMGAAAKEKLHRESSACEVARLTAEVYQEAVTHAHPPLGQRPPREEEKAGAL